MNVSTVLILIILGLTAGFLGGFAGVGGAIIIIPGLIFLLGMTQFQAQGTSLAMMIPPIGILAAFNYYKNGFVNWKFALILALAFVVGAYLGSKIVLDIPQNIVKRAFGILLIFVALKLIFSK